MAAPRYFLENRYSFVADLRPARKVLAAYEVRSPENEFELSVLTKLAEANEYLHREEYTLALRAYQQIQWGILQAVHPQLPPDPGSIPFLWSNAVIGELIHPMVDYAAGLLKKSRAPRPGLPEEVISKRSLPPVVLEALRPFVDAGLTTSWKAKVEVAIGRAENELAAGRVAAAQKELTDAVAVTPRSESALLGALQHDLSIVHQRAGDAAAALAAAMGAVKLFTGTRQVDQQVASMKLVADVQRRSGDVAAAKQTLDAAGKLANAHGLAPIEAMRTVNVPPSGHGAIVAPVLHGIPRAAAALEVSTPEFGSSGLISKGFLSGTATAAALVLYGGAGQRVEIALGDQATANLTNFYEKRVALEDIAILTGIHATYTQLVAYIPHIYFFVIPMAIGDCHLAMGDFDRAEAAYLSVLPYPYLSNKTEVPLLWMRLADVELQYGRHLYTSARADVARYPQVRARYERIIRGNRTVDTASPLYAHARLAPMRARVNAIAASADPVALDENPAVIQRVLSALGFLDQIAANLNFFGLSNNYVPPFTFEHLYNLTLHFGNQAQQAEQRYIQFKSQAENEELRREQLAQQLELTKATVDLEKLGRAEASAGVASATASVNYAETQRVNAVQSEAEFAAVRWELLELSTLEAWANASAVDRDDQVKLTISGYSYYNTTDTRRNVVIKDLAAQRTRLTHDLEASRLVRATASAAAYKAVAQAQLNQAIARRAMAEKRVVIAMVQERHAAENLEFTDLKEFGEAMWYELALDARRRMRHYLDMATEVAFLMERAYNAETGRDLAIVKFDYGVPGLGDLTGAGALVSDADYFQLDYARTQTKKAPVKEVMSIAESFPSAFLSLIQTGICHFETTLDMFDRLFPGQYLHKIRSVEVVFVGLSRAAGVHGTLRNIGVSTFRKSDGSIHALAYPADVMPLSAYEVRNDAVVFRVDPKLLRLFENNGVATLWQLDLPRSTNDLDYRSIFDVQLVMHYDAFFDPTLEATVRAALPTTGAASRSVSMRIEAPDELFYLRNQGSAQLVFDASAFPRTQEDLVRTRVTLRATGSQAANLVLRLESASDGVTRTVTLGADGMADSAAAPLSALVGRPMLDTWKLTIQAADNPGLVAGGVLDLGGIEDVGMFFEYTFRYRS